MLQYLEVTGGICKRYQINSQCKRQRYDENSQELYLPQPWATGGQATFQPASGQNYDNNSQELYLPQPWATQATVESWEYGATTSNVETESIKKE